MVRAREGVRRAQHPPRPITGQPRPRQQQPLVMAWEPQSVHSRPPEQMLQERCHPMPGCVQTTDNWPSEQSKRENILAPSLRKYFNLSCIRNYFMNYVQINFYNLFTDKYFHDFMKHYPQVALWLVSQDGHDQSMETARAIVHLRATDDC